jgi:hypothetical protein
MRHDLVVSFPKKFLLDSLSLIRRAQDGGLSRLSKLLSDAQIFFSTPLQLFYMK